MAVWINEFHYDNAGADAGEFVEIAGSAGTDLSGYSVVLYNGNGGVAYLTLPLSGLIANQQNGFGVVSIAATGLQNGSPDGIALVGPGNAVIEFLSYEGVFAAADGPAAGMTSVDVGVSEPGSANGTSIARTGTGDEASDFTFVVATDDTPGAVNNGQSFVAPQPQVSVADIEVTEGNAGTVDAIFTLTRTGADGAFTVDFTTADGTAEAGSDYVATSGTATFAEGENTATVTVTVNGDLLEELDEAFTLELSNATGGAIIAEASGEATIVNDDAATPVITIEATDATATEGSADGTVGFTLTRLGDTTDALTVDYTIGGTATAGDDFTGPTTGQVTFAAGSATATLDYTAIDDAAVENDETIEITLADGADYDLGTPSDATATIASDDFDVTAIHDIQGNAFFSPILTEDGVTTFNTQSVRQVTIQAVVTALDDTGARQGFFVTDEAADWDSDYRTSEGLFVMTRNDAGSGQTLTSVAPNVTVGELVTITGFVMEYQAFDNLPRTMLVNPTVVQESGTVEPLPTLVLDGLTPETSIPNSILTDEIPNHLDSSDDGGDTFDPGSDALDFFETVEGMRVTIPDMVVADGFVSGSNDTVRFKAYSTAHADADQLNDRGGYTVAGDPPLSPPDTPEDPDDDVNAGGSYLHDGDVNPDIIELDFSEAGRGGTSGFHNTLDMGDGLGDVSGVLDFDFENVKLYVTDEVTVESQTPIQETTALTEDARSLRVATFNVENLDPTDGQAKFDDLAEAIATNLAAPDILTIEEIQDNNGAGAGDGVNATGADASTTWQTLADAVSLATGDLYQWVDQEPDYNTVGGEPNGNIRVGFLYNTTRVQLGDLDANASLAERRRYVDSIGDGVRDAGDLIAFDDAQIGSELDTADWAATRKSLLGEFTFNGNAVYVASNHLPSKGGSEAFYQFNQNLPTSPANGSFQKRADIAQDIWSVLDTIKTGDAESRVISGGDYNEFYFYRAMEAATGYVTADGVARTGGARFDNLTVTELAEAERYTYEFDGRSQAIDHIIVDQELSAVADYDVVHINTGYNGRSGAVSPALSDHDPALARFDFRDFGERLTGTAAAETIEGFGGDDVLVGVGGLDTLVGGEGDDTYVVNRIGATVVETADEGVDTVIASVDARFGEGFTYVLADNVENLTFSSRGSFNGMGNDLDNDIVGNAGTNRLDGGAGADIMRGGLGNDVFIVQQLGDRAIEAAGAGLDKVISSVDFTLGGNIEQLLLGGLDDVDGTGNILANLIRGNAEDNVINGRLQSDTLTGGAGADAFVFDTVLSPTNVDTITDFTRGEDVIRIDNAFFTGLRAGALPAGAFALGAAATEADDRILYDAGAGRLFFDRDGSGTGFAAVAFANVGTVAGLDASDFQVI